MFRPRATAVPGYVLVVLLAVALAILVPPVTPAQAVTPSAGAGAYVKYVVVEPVDGRLPTLRELAVLLLGDERRLADLLSLNRGRLQPDGSALTDPDLLRAGWLIVLPWDSAGPQVRTGLLPSAGPSVTPGPSPTGRPPLCTAPAPRRSGGLPWAQLRLAPQAAWVNSRGAGVTVAILDSGVDADVPALSGRVLPGADATSGTNGSTPSAGAGRGDSDCTGRGTAMAGIVAAEARAGTDFVGVAPEATVLPIKVGRSGRYADATAVLTGLRLASGAQVAMIGGAVDLSDELVVAALAAAVAAGTVVVVAAPPPTGRPGRPLPAGVLRVGAVGADEQPVETYRDGEVDVLAPGADVVSLGVGGTGEVEVTGTGFAVSFVAGVAALVRSAAPQLTAAQVAARITGTAAGAASGAADPVSGWGLTDPAAAVGAPRPSEPETSASVAPAASSFAALVGTLALAAILMLGMRRRS